VEHRRINPLTCAHPSSRSPEGQREVRAKLGQLVPGQEAQSTGALRGSSALGYFLRCDMAHFKSKPSETRQEMLQNKGAINFLASSEGQILVAFCSENPHIPFTRHNLMLSSLNKEMRGIPRWSFSPLLTVRQTGGSSDRWKEVIRPKLASESKTQDLRTMKMKESEGKREEGKR
jgi:hypothetical protein